MERTQDLDRSRVGPAITRARWIWGGEDPRPLNAYRLFRAEFELDRDLTDTSVTICAEARYRLSVNGVIVGAGPAPSRPEQRLYDRVPITPHARRGANCIAVEVSCPGLMTGDWTLVNPGLVAAVEAGDGPEPLLVTDSSWRTVTGDGWVTITQICPYAKGFHEHVDTTMLPTGWTEVGYDDSGWDRALELPHFAYGYEPDRALNDTGGATLHRHGPIRLVATGIVDGVVTDEMREREAAQYRWARNRWRRQMGAWTIPMDEPLPQGEAPPEPLSELAAREIRLSVIPVRGSGPSVVPLRVTGSEAGHPFAVWDFGTVRSGFLSFELRSDSGGTVDLAWDDRIDEHGDVAHARATPNCDRVIVGPGSRRWTGLSERGLRYLKVIFRGFTGDVILNALEVVETLTPLPLGRSASFACDDQLLERLWRAAADTVRSYMNGCGAGDPIRERCHWLHDDAMALRMAFTCFGDWRAWRRGLELTAQSQNSDGSLPVVSPGHFEDYNMVAGSCYWAVQIAEYHRHTGDNAFAVRMLPAIDRFVSYELRFADAHGLLYETPGRRFLSWADARPRPAFAEGEIWDSMPRQDFVPWGNFFEPPTWGYNAIINACWLWCLREVADLAAALGEECAARRYRAVFETARPLFDAIFFDDDAGLYRDNVAYDRDGVPSPPSFCESTQYSVARAGLIDPATVVSLHRRLRRPGFLCCRTTGGLDLGSVPVALFESGLTAEALDLYRDVWGPPILAGATTCGEQFYRSPGNSDCHIHGASPARDLLEYFAGIRLYAPFYREVLLVPPVVERPVPGFRAVVPTPGGDIEVRYRSSNGRRSYTYRVPPASQCLLRLPGTREPVHAANSGEVEL